MPSMRLPLLQWGINELEIIHIKEEAPLVPNIKALSTSWQLTFCSWWRNCVTAGAQLEIKVHPKLGDADCEERAAGGTHENAIR